MPHRSSKEGEESSPEERCHTFIDYIKLRGKLINKSNSFLITITSSRAKWQAEESCPPQTTCQRGCRGALTVKTRHKGCISEQPLPSKSSPEAQTPLPWNSVMLLAFLTQALIIALVSITITRTSRLKCKRFNFCDMFCDFQFKM